MTTLLLIQARAPDDPQVRHEELCIERRMAGVDVDIVTRNAIADRAEACWIEGVDGVIIGGSGAFSVNHALSQRWVTPLRRVLEAILRKSLPMFGICFGHQLLGLHLGAKVETHGQLQEVGTIPLEKTRQGTGCALFSGLSARFAAHTGHSDHVSWLPEGVELLARGAHVQMQAFGVIGLPVFTTQFHPDLTGVEARERFLAVKSASSDKPTAALERQAEAFCLEGYDEAATLLRRFVDAFCAVALPEAAAG